MPVLHFAFNFVVCAGTYWGVVSTPFCAEIIEAADAYIFAGEPHLPPVLIHRRND